jgi:hypothetical protein
MSSTQRYFASNLQLVPILPDTVAITVSERFSLIPQADPDTDEVYAQMTLQPVNTVSI